MKKILIVMFAITLISCGTNNKTNTNERNYQLGAYLWHQRSGEYRALCYQAYNYAKLIIKNDLQNKHNKKRAVVFDIDETVLDNSFGGAYEVKNNIPWAPSNFNEWVKKVAAEAIPGAVDFIDYLIANNIEPIFISNRTVDQVEDTFANFQKVGLKGKKENFIFMSSDWSKEKRRLEVLRKYDIVLFVGDNLTDFHKMFDKETSDNREKLVDENRLSFGERFIILPNPLYGDWEKSLPKTETKYDLLITK